MGRWVETEEPKRNQERYEMNMQNSIQTVILSCGLSQGPYTCEVSVLLTAPQCHLVFELWGSNPAGSWPEAWRRKQSHVFLSFEKSDVKKSWMKSTQICLCRTECSYWMCQQIRFELPVCTSPWQIVIMSNSQKTALRAKDKQSCSPQEHSV